MSNELSERMSQGLARIGLAMKHNAWRRSGSRGLHPTQGQVLAILRQHHDTDMGTGDIARQLAVTPATASDSIRTLIEKGLIRKTASKRDRRAVVLRLTPDGRREADRVLDWPDFLSSAVQTLSESEQRVFIRAMMKMIRSLQESGRIPISRMCASCRFFRPHAYDDAENPHHCDFVNAPFGDADLRFDCADHQPTENPETLWRLFIHGKPATV